MVEPSGEADDDRGRVALGRRLISNALQYYPAAISQLSGLRNLKHDKDLLPLMQRQLRMLLDAFHRDTAAAYDIQGFTDQGCDVLIRLESAAGPQFICIQVKSHDELANPEMVNKLLLQYGDADDHYAPMSNFYVALAADLNDAKKQQQVVRRVQQKFAKKSKARVVDPAYLATFLRMTPSTMDSIVTQTLRKGDPVMTAALADLQRHPLAAAIILRMTVGLIEGRTHFSRDELLHDRWLQAVAELIPLPHLEGMQDSKSWDREFIGEVTLRRLFAVPPFHDPEAIEAIGGEEVEEFFSGDVDDLLGNLPPELIRHYLAAEDTGPGAPSRLLEIMAEVLDVMEFDNSVGTLRLDIDEHSALLCLAAEGRVRHGLSGGELIGYLVNLILTSEA
ncbi:hypothetical protein [Saccharothrix sp. HUAS TT1]|uniref:hypothetical protein n=1 Tax=unclassified Saccharothrix TaxID=2593673 RepID=UPI00345B4C7C